MADKSRQQFERLAAKEGLSLEVFNGDYDWMNTRLAWKFWQASRESLEIELPERKNYSGFKQFDDGYERAIDDCENILISNGVKIKK